MGDILFATHADLTPEALAGIERFVEETKKPCSIKPQGRKDIQEDII